MRREHAFGALGLALLVTGHYMGLVLAPPEAMMGEVGRILYVHVPTAWTSLLCYTAALVGAVGMLWDGRRGWEAMLEATVEVGLLLNVMLLIQGSIWARPTWGVWWTWDARLTTAAIMAVFFATVLVLRNVIDAPERRSRATAVATIVAYVDVILVYYSVKLWNTLHQPFSSPKTVDGEMVTPLRVAAFGMIFLAIGFSIARYRIALRRLEAEDDAPEPPPLPPQINLEARP